jgi:ABC-2 type transport system permease protein
MNKIGLILKREYLTRVKKRSFIIMTFLGPILMATVWILAIVLAQRSEGVKVIEVIDETSIFFNELKDKDDIRFVYISDDLRSAREKLADSEHFGILYIPLPTYSEPKTVYLYSNGNPGLSLKSYIQNSVERIMKDKKLLDTYGITSDDLASVQSDISLVVRDLETEEESYAEVTWALGFIGGMLIYMFIFMYGAQVMRGVIEEKTSRIVEVIVSSAKPFQLMAGKIIGIAFVGLTQFMLWIVLTLAIVGVFGLIYGGSMDQQEVTEALGSRPGGIMSIDPSQQGLDETAINIEEAGIESKILDIVGSINAPLMIFSFIFLFLGGYLLYAALFAALGSAVDNETDTQQFMMPITIPLVLAIVVGLSFVLNNPDGQVAYWMSIFPLTSPVVMMIRIPFGGVEIVKDIIPAAILLIAGFIATTWLAAKIYRTGILLYGKKVTYKELWKWVRHS